jgi:hypothetical protein
VPSSFPLNPLIFDSSGGFRTTVRILKRRVLLGALARRLTLATAMLAGFARMPEAAVPTSTPAISGEWKWGLGRGSEPVGRDNGPFKRWWIYAACRRKLHDRAVDWRPRGIARRLVHSSDVITDSATLPSASVRPPAGGLRWCAVLCWFSSYVWRIADSGEISNSPHTGIRLIRDKEEAQPTG